MSKERGAKYIRVLEVRVEREIRMSGNGVGSTAEVRGGIAFSAAH